MNNTSTHEYNAVFNIWNAICFCLDGGVEVDDQKLFIKLVAHEDIDRINKLWPNYVRSVINTGNDNGEFSQLKKSASG